MLWDMKLEAEVSLNASLHHVMHKEDNRVRFLEWTAGMPWIQCKINRLYHVSHESS